MQTPNPSAGIHPAAEDRHPDFCAKVKSAQQKKGASLLSDEELLLLACDALSRTFTYDEKDYR
jgi:hypothetical protein